MHDPRTIAHQLRLPILGNLTIWHVDPETDGTDDSCDWFGHRKTRETGWYPAAVDDYERMEPVTQRAIDFVWWQWRGKLTTRPWWRHPRWHIRHWKISIDFVSTLQRWLWSRCADCGRRFRWGYAPVSTQWDGGGPGWFRGEEHVYHHEHVPPPPDWKDPRGVTSTIAP